MAHAQLQRPITADFASLEASVERARLALACSFSSSDEFEAAIIRERRAAGRYGLTARQRHFSWGFALLVLLTFILAVIS